MSQARIATCRVCGAQGLEDETDPAPSLCPSCLEATMDRLMEPLARLMRRHGRVIALSRIHDEMVAAGLTSAAATSFLAVADLMSGGER